MQEFLRVYTAHGDEILSRDLSEQRVALMITAGERPTLVESADAGVTIIGAVVRDEDGWTLVSNRVDVPVTCGPKQAADMHLVAGIGYALGGVVFRLERAGETSGNVLVWKIGADYAVDELVKGRNVVGTNPGAQRLEVNPAVIGDVLCEIYPTATGVDVVTEGEGGARLSVDRATLFSVGAFQAMALTAQEAAQAMKSGNAFAWPSRGTRRLLLLALIGVALIALWGARLHREALRVEGAANAYRGAVQVPPRPIETEAVSDEDVLVYELSFFRSLPIVLSATPTATEADLIRRGEQLASVAKIRPYVAFLKEVEAIQTAIGKGEWRALGERLASVDKTMFVKCDAMVFYNDAHEIAEFVTQALPKFMAEVSRPGSPEFKHARKKLAEYFEGMKDNLFMSGEVIRRERDTFHARWEALSVYVPARDAFLADDASDGVTLLAAWTEFANVFDAEDQAVAAIVQGERKRVIDSLLQRVDAAQDALLVHLSDLGEAVGVPEATLAAWRRRAREARRELEEKYRKLYGEYRLKSAVAPDDPEARQILEEMIKLGLEENRYNQWAQRELERVKGKQK